MEGYYGKVMPWLCYAMKVVVMAYEGYGMLKIYSIHMVLFYVMMAVTEKERS